MNHVIIEPEVRSVIIILFALRKIKVYGGKHRKVYGDKE